ncbi:hypothetical protein HY988_05920 [Candidatus Micrarchaeota archaeon]|nr:hypothetical protein [Candidatus Micrarchaeota archaeon]
MVRSGAGTNAGPSARANFPREPFQSSTYLVHTIYGVSLVNARSKVYVKVGSEYLVKLIEDVAKGEEILFAKEGIPEATLDNIGVALAKSSRYAAAQPILFRRLKDGKLTTAFRYALLEGIIQPQSGWPKSLSGNGKIRSLIAGEKDVELGEEEGRAATHFIHESLVAAHVQPVTEDHMKYGWLGGKVIAPRNRLAVFDALKGIAPKLSELADQQFSDAYRLYITIRQKVMEAIALILSGKPVEKAHATEGEGKEQGEGLSVKPEIALVAEHFASDISEKYAVGRVIEIRKLNGQQKAEKEQGNRFFKGVVTGEISDEKVKIKPLTSIMYENSVIMPIVRRVTYEFLIRERIPVEWLGWVQQPPHITLISETGDAFGYSDRFRRNYGRFREKLALAGATLLDKFAGEVAERADYSDTPLAQQVTKAEQILISKLTDGTMDQLYGCPSGTLLRVFDLYYKLTHSVPFEMFYNTHLRELIKSKKAASVGGMKINTTAEEDEVAKTIAHLKNMGLEFDEHGDMKSYFIGTAAFVTVFGIPKATGENYSLECRVFNGEISPNEALQLAGLDLIKAKVSGNLVADREALALLKEMGFESVSHLYPKAGAKLKPYF